MNKFLKITIISLTGAVSGLVIWATFYLANKTPAIEFDGPAIFGIIVSALLGLVVFGLAGLILARPKH